MTASMLDEVVVPKDPQLYVCPCCKFSFRKKEKYIEHLKAMIATVDAALRKVSK